MKYMGSKSRIAKHILPIILENRTEGQYYVEPFCGGCNTIDKVKGNRIANDYNKYLIAFCKSLASGVLPPENVSEEYYKEIKANKGKFPDELLGYVGFQLTFGSGWFDTYRRDKTGVRNYSKEAFNNVKKQQPDLVGIDFNKGSYDSFYIPLNSIIYCDPPYKNTSGYKAGQQDFDYEKFYDWCRKMKRSGHKIFISEYNMPDDFIQVWQGEIKTNFASSRTKATHNAIEKLFTL